MSDLERELRLLRETWKASQPNSAEVQRGVEKVARRLRQSHRRRGGPDQRAWGAFGAGAVLLAALAYAHNGGLHNDGWGRLSSSRSSSATLGGTRATSRSFDRAAHAWGANAVGVAASAGTSAESAPSDAAGELAQAPKAPSGAQNAPHGLGSPKEAARVAEGAVANVGEGNDAQVIELSELDDGAAIVPALTAKPSAPGVGRRASSSRASRASLERTKAQAEPSWVEVSNALAAGNPARAEELLTQLAAQGHDADTRAKAKLGIAQLDAARSDCTRAKSLALQAASTPGAEIKTVRRALELAAKCK